MRIDGQRIYLRDHEPGDLDAYHAWRSSPVVTRYLSGRTSTLDETFLELAECLKENRLPNRAKYYFAVVLKATGTIIGEAGFTIEASAEHGGRADLGYFLLPAYWGQGYAAEATRLMLAFCFTVLKLHKVTAGCDAENTASEKVMKKCGMQREAYLRKHAMLDGVWHDRLVYAILVEEWAERQEVNTVDFSALSRQNTEGR